MYFVNDALGKNIAFQCLTLQNLLWALVSAGILKNVVKYASVHGAASAARHFTKSWLYNSVQVKVL